MIKDVWSDRRPRPCWVVVISTVAPYQATHVESITSGNVLKTTPCMMGIVWAISPDGIIAQILCCRDTRELASVNLSWQDSRRVFTRWKRSDDAILSSASASDGFGESLCLYPVPQWSHVGPPGPSAPWTNLDILLMRNEQPCPLRGMFRLSIHLDQYNMKGRLGRFFVLLSTSHNL